MQSTAKNADCCGKCESTWRLVYACVFNLRFRLIRSFVLLPNGDNILAENLYNKTAEYADFVPTTNFLTKSLFYLFSVLYYDLLSILGIPNDSPETTLRRGMAGIQFNIGILDLAKEENMLLF